MKEHEEIVETDGPMLVAIRRPDGEGSFPVVVFHDGPGLREDVHDVTRTLARAGYYAVLSDLDHRIGPKFSFDMAEIDPSAPEFERLMATVGSLDDEVLTDVAAMLDVVAEDPAAGSGATGAVGFCMGARFTFRLLAADPDGFAAAATMCPSFCDTDDPNSPHRSIRTIPAERFGAFGAADTLASRATNAPLREELDRAEVRSSVEILDEADHGFMSPGLPAYHAHAASVSGERTLDMFGRTLVARVARP
jgi:carboxymethylenebutenolidase